MTKTYDGRIRALRDVSLRLEPGEFVALTGPSGSGKSTLLQLIGGLDRPDQGDVRVDSVSVPGLAHPARFRRDVVGFVFQLHHLLPHLSARANVELAMIGTGRSKPERVDRAQELLSEVGLGDRADALPSELSGGERQRIALARAFLKDAPLLVLDEPTSSVDVATEATIMDAMERLMHGRTTFMIAHRLSTLDVCDARLELEGGRIADSSGLDEELPAPR